MRSEYITSEYMAQHAATMARLLPTPSEVQRAAMRRQQSMLARVMRALFN